MVARVAALLLVCAAACVPFAAAEPRLDGTPRPVRVEGYWDRTRADREVIGDVSVSAEGYPPRRFGVTALQAYQPEEEGMQVLRFTSDHPATLVARGDAVDRFFAAPKGRKVKVFATYVAGSGLFIIGSVEVAAPPAAPRR
jgi:hypothetical protein